MILRSVVYPGIGYKGEAMMGGSERGDGSAYCLSSETDTHKQVVQRFS
jgi:hypothetical protein